MRRAWICFPIHKLPNMLNKPTMESDHAHARRQFAERHDPRQMRCNEGDVEATGEESRRQEQVASIPDCAAHRVAQRSRLLVLSMHDRAGRSDVEHKRDCRKADCADNDQRRLPSRNPDAKLRQGYEDELPHRSTGTDDAVRYRALRLGDPAANCRGELRGSAGAGADGSNDADHQNQRPGAVCKRY
jgi:hypothetical protein